MPSPALTLLDLLARPEFLVGVRAGTFALFGFVISNVRQGWVLAVASGTLIDFG